jgi:hypothetical protein
MGWTTVVLVVHIDAFEMVVTSSSLEKQNWAG